MRAELNVLRISSALQISFTRLWKLSFQNGKNETRGAFVAGDPEQSLRDLTGQGKPSLPPPIFSKGRGPLPRERFWSFIVVFKFCSPKGFFLRACLVVAYGSPLATFRGVELVVETVPPPSPPSPDRLG